ncbi:hypothetical protein MTT09_06830 [Campylobacter concisus]|uniref:hypothetical protein n=1 Tax=Campylobacter concisus TaxID=199 RepID=UPI003D240B47
MLVYLDIHRAYVSLRAVVMQYQVVCPTHDLSAIYSGVNFIADLFFDALSDDLIKGFFIKSTPFMMIKNDAKAPA